MIANIVGVVALLVIFSTVLWMVWNILEFAYRITMFCFYSVLYVAVTLWEVLVWVVMLPFRIVRWIYRTFNRE